MYSLAVEVLKLLLLPATLREPESIVLPLPEAIVRGVAEPFLNLNSVPVESVPTPINQGCVRLPLVFLNSK